MQSRILSSAARLVKQGGRLVYATCSMLQEENQKQVTAFLETHPEFKLMPLQAALPDQLSKLAARHPAMSMLALTPAQHQTDGFFAAVLERVS